MKRSEWSKPALLSAATHFLPDNSGICCPVCCQITADEYEHTCEECFGGETPGVVNDKRIGSWYEPDRLMYAILAHNGDVGICAGCVYAVRLPDGRGRHLCLHCVTKDDRHRDLALCSECGYLLPRAGVASGRCGWCSALGRECSLLVCAGVAEAGVEPLRYLGILGWFRDRKGGFVDVPKSVVETKTAEGGENVASAVKRLVDARVLRTHSEPVRSFKRPDGTMAAESRWMQRIELLDVGQTANAHVGRPGEAFTRRDGYKALVEALDTPSGRQLLAELVEIALQDGAGACEDRIREQDWSDLLDDLPEVVLCSTPEMGLLHVARREARRFARDPRFTDVFLGFEKDDHGVIDGPRIVEDGDGGEKDEDGDG